MIVRLLLGALCAVLFTTAVHACDAMRPCFANGKLLYGVQAAFPGGAASSRRDRVVLKRAERRGTSPTVRNFRTVQHTEKTRRFVKLPENPAIKRVPRGLARVMAEGAGRAAGIVRSATGATARVASRATGAFQCLVSALDRQGYPIRFMGGWRRHGSVRASLHPAGLALDINQYRRNVTKPRMPHNEIALANACGLVSGAQWANGDSGHFQLGGWAGRHVAYRRHHHRHYASAP